MVLFGAAIGAAIAALGCDTGGLLVVEGRKAPPTPVQGPSSTELVSGGTTASNGKHRIVYVMGQPTPQSVSTSPSRRLNGGLPGAVSDP